MINKNHYFLKILSFLFLIFILYSCDPPRKDRVHRAFAEVVKEQVKQAVIEVEKKSEDPSTWPKIGRVVVFKDYAMVEFRYYGKTFSQMLLKRQNNRWTQLLSEDLIGFNTMIKMKVPPEVVREIFSQFN